MEHEYIVHLNIQTDKVLTEDDIRIMVANLMLSLNNGDIVDIAHHEEL